MAFSVQNWTKIALLINWEKLQNLGANVENLSNLNGQSIIYQKT